MINTINFAVHVKVLKRLNPEFSSEEKKMFLFI